MTWFVYYHPETKLYHVYKPEGAELRLIAVDEYMSNIRKQAEEQGATVVPIHCERE